MNEYIRAVRKDENEVRLHLPTCEPVLMKHKFYDQIRWLPICDMLSNRNDKRRSMS